ncbi:MAG: hypothetical protein ACXVJT_04140 [Thermoanaerobaculia bacterium]
MNIDESLRQALARKAPPAGFRGRVFQGMAAAQRRRPLSRWRAAAAVLLVGGALGGFAVHRIEQQRQGERARAQVMLAFQIASQKAHYAREEVRDISRSQSR